MERFDYIKSAYQQLDRHEKTELLQMIIESEDERHNLRLAMNDCDTSDRITLLETVLSCKLAFYNLNEKAGERFLTCAKDLYAEKPKCVSDKEVVNTLLDKEYPDTTIIYQPQSLQEATLLEEFIQQRLAPNLNDSWKYSNSLFH